MKKQLKKTEEVKTVYPPKLNFKEMLLKDFFIINRGIIQSEYLKLRYVFSDKLFFNYNGVTYRAIYLIDPTLFNHPGVTGEGTLDGYVAGFPTNNIGGPPKIVATSAVYFINL